MAKYRLLVEHSTSDGRVLPAGTEVGDGTPEPWPMEPSNQMEGLDDDGKKRVDEFWQSRYGHPKPGENPNLSDDAKRQLAKEEEEKVKAEEAKAKGPPVSEAQKAEREAEAEGRPSRGIPPGAAPGPSSTATASPTRGGVTAPSPGPATAEVRRENIRPSKPNEEQSPKD